MRDKMVAMEPADTPVDQVYEGRWPWGLVVVLAPCRIGDDGSAVATASGRL
jgi:hypothetical protein